MFFACREEPSGSRHAANPAEAAVLAAIERFYRRSWLHRPVVGALETTNSGTRLPHPNHEVARRRATREMSGRAALGLTIRQMIAFPRQHEDRAAARAESRESYFGDAESSRAFLLDSRGHVSAVHYAMTLSSQAANVSTSSQRTSESFCPVRAGT